MNHRTFRLCAVLALAFCLTLAACGKSAPSAPTPTAEPTPEPVHFAAGDVSPTSAELRMPLAAGETALLDALSELRSADLSGSADEEAVAAWAKAHPGVAVRYTVTLPNGTVLPSDTTSYDLSAASGAECEAAAPKLALLPQLQSLNLGREDGRLSWANIRVLRRSLPKTTFQYSFDLYGKPCNLSDTTISLFHVPVKDNGRLIDEVIGYMPQLTKVDMDGCGLPPLRLEEINLSHPKTQVIFRVWFGENYSVRTDVERILASMPSKGGMLTPYNCEGLFFCHDVKYLDLGHNTDLTDISFVAQMPKLEVVILSMCNWSDASPLAYCSKLEYLEMTNTYCKDLRPLAGLKSLHHLNVAATGYDQPQDGTERIRLTDITPLYGLTDLERLWIGAFNPVPHEQVEEMQRRVPYCEINTEVYEDPVGGRWRYIALADYINTYVDTNHPRYDKLREQFGYGDERSYAFSWNDPLYSEDAVAPDLNAPKQTPAPVQTPVPKPVVTPYVETQYYPVEPEEEYSEEQPAQEEPAVPTPDPYADPGYQAPTPETPVQEEPTPETPVQEEPTPEAPVQEEPVSETPLQEEPVPEAPVQEEPPAEPAAEVSTEAEPAPTGAENEGA